MLSCILICISYNINNNIIENIYQEYTPNDQLANKNRRLWMDSITIISVYSMKRKRFIRKSHQIV
jgi:hypothetical protein